MLLLFLMLLLLLQLSPLLLAALHRLNLHRCFALLRCISRPTVARRWQYPLVYAHSCSQQCERRSCLLYRLLSGFWRDDRRRDKRPCRHREPHNGGWSVREATCRTPAEKCPWRRCSPRPQQMALPR